MEETAKPVREISRRTMLKVAGVGAAVVWTAPILSSVRAPAFAQGSGGGGCSDCGCDLNTPCNMAIDCNNSGGICNCWVRQDAKCCWCGPFDACTNHQPCASQADCSGGEICITNCCGSLCYAPCNVAKANPKTKGPRGVRTR